MTDRMINDVFLSYAREDKEFTSKIETALGKQGWRVFKDREIRSGMRWENVLVDQLNQIRCILVLWSKSSVNSKWVLKEARRGLERKNLVQVSIDSTAPPDEFLPYQYRELSALRSEGPDSEYALLLRDIAELVGIDRPVGTLPDPGPAQITADHLTLVHSCWKRKADQSNVESVRAFPYQIHLMVFGSQTAMSKIENVVYYFDPAYAVNRPTGVDTLLNAYVLVRDDPIDNFSVYEFANGYSVVRAKVKVKSQTDIVELSRFVNMADEGPWLKNDFL